MWPSCQDTIPNRRRVLPDWTKPQSAGIAESLNVQPNRKEAVACGGPAVGAVPG
jgi:hypothetical protein